MKFTYPDWLTCKKGLLGGHSKVRRTVKILLRTALFTSRT